MVSLFLLIGEGPECALAADARHREVAILVLGHEAGGHKLLQQVQGSITFALAALHHLDLGLECVVLLDLGLRLPLYLLLCL